MKGLDNYIMGINNPDAPFNSHLITNWLDTIHNDDCFNVMPKIERHKVDLILADLPYGTTACKWDAKLPFKEMWNEFNRLLKPTGVIVLTASQPFTSALVMSNPKMFKYEWIWEKSRPSGIALSKSQPMRKHENILVFANGKTTFNKILEDKEYMGEKSKRGVWNTWNTSSEHGLGKTNKKLCNEKRNPTTVLKVASTTNFPKSFHPTQKPLALMEYLIRTYTNDGELVLDCCMGSGTTCLAAKRTGRSYIGIEQDEKYFKIAEQRLNETLL